MTTRSQKNAVAELVSGDFEASVAEKSQTEKPVAGPSKFGKMQAENIDEIKTSFRQEIMFDLTKILAEYQNEML